MTAHADNPRQIRRLSWDRRHFDCGLIAYRFGFTLNKMIEIMALALAR